MNWREIFSKIIISVISAGIIGTIGWIITSKINSYQPIEATATWTSVPDFRDFKLKYTPVESDNLKSTLQKSESISSILSFMKYASHVKFGTINLKNDSDTRSGEVEISIADGILFSDAIINNDTSLKSLLKINQIDPGDSASVYFITKSWYSEYSNPIKIIHNNKIVNLIQSTVPDIFPFYRKIVVEYQFITIMWLLFSLFIMVIFIIAFAVYLFVDDKIAYEAKNATKEKILEMIKIIDYTKDHFPEKLPESKPQVTIDKNPE